MPQFLYQKDYPYHIYFFKVGVDFTASNGEPTSLHSLHYCGQQQKENEYIRALRSVGEICEDYDT